MRLQARRPLSGPKRNEAGPGRVHEAQPVGRHADRPANLRRDRAGRPERRGRGRAGAVRGQRVNGRGLQRELLAGHADAQRHDRERPPRDGSRPGELLQHARAGRRG